MRKMEKAILKTLAYADVFDYPLKREEIWKYLINCELRIANCELRIRELERGLGALLEGKKVGVRSGYYFLSGREEIVGLRKKREKWSREKIKKAKRVAGLLKIIPTVKLVGISGALAMENCDKDDDIDLFIVTAAGRLWLTRFLVTLLVELTGQRRRPGVSLANSPTLRVKNSQPKGFSLGSLRIIRVNPLRRLRSVLIRQAERKRGVNLWKSASYKDKICLNMFVDEDHLAIPPKERNLFTSHEVAQMKPLWDKDDVYERFLGENRWVGKWLANSMEVPEFQSSRVSKSDKKGKKLCHFATLPLCHLLNGLEKLLTTLQLKYMTKRRTTEKISPGRILFHPEDKGKWVMREYNEKLKMKK